MRSSDIASVIGWIQDGPARLPDARLALAPSSDLACGRLRSSLRRERTGIETPRQTRDIADKKSETTGIFIIAAQKIYTQAYSNQAHKLIMS